MPLEKLKIINLDQEPPEEFEVLFNPTEYSIEDGNTWEEQKRERQKPELQFTGQVLKKLSMDLFLDTYEQNEDVRQYTSKIAKLLVVSVDSGDGARPPIIRLNWGPADPDPANGIFPFKCVLESLKQQFILFTGNGMPVRAKLTVSFKEYRLPEEEQQHNPPRRSFPVKTYTVKTSDTMSGIAAALWKNPFKWRLIARANDIYNPRILKPGQVLVIPEIE